MSLIQSTPSMIQFDSGTKRTTRKPIYHLVPIELMEAVAHTRAEGDLKYQPGNWQQGDKEFFVDCLSHAIGHLMDYAWDDSEDHLGHAACNIGFILWALKRGKVKREDFVEAARVVNPADQIQLFARELQKQALYEDAARKAADTR